MLCKAEKGALIKIRVDMVSDRPHAVTNYQLQGTDDVYESGRGGLVDRGKIWLRTLSEKIRWFDMGSFMEMGPIAREHMPEIWLNPLDEALRAGHGGGDYFEVLDFIKAVRGEAHCPIGIHEAMDMTLPGLISQQSIQRGGRWLNVPNSREWKPGPAPAVKMYLTMGFLPLLYREDMPECWRALCEKLDRPFTPGDWPER